MADGTAAGSGAHESGMADVKGKGKAVAEPGQDQSMDEESSSSEEEHGEEEQHGEEEEEDEDNMEEINTDNIVSERTRGRNIDWQKAESQLSGELDDDDDDDDEDFVAKEDDDAMQE